MQVREIMTRNPACCTPDSSLKDVALMMKNNDCGCIPVVESMSGMKPVGTITDRDITIRTVADNHNPIDMKAADIMTTDIATVRQSASIEECFDVMEDREIRRVLIVDEQGKCCGIVAQADVVQSKANPVRTNKVIREISEANPSQNRRASMKPRKNYQSESEKTSFINGGAVLPLLLGLGSGVALMYYLNEKQKPTNQRSFDATLNSFSHKSEFSNSTNEENFGKYVDAEQEIENRQNNIQDKVQAFRSEANIQPNNILELPETEDETTSEKGRSANQF